MRSCRSFLAHVGRETRPSHSSCVLSLVLQVEQACAMPAGDTRQSRRASRMRKQLAIDVMELLLGYRDDAVDVCMCPFLVRALTSFTQEYALQTSSWTAELCRHPMSWLPQRSNSFVRWSLACQVLGNVWLCMPRVSTKACCCSK